MKGRTSAVRENWAKENSCIWTQNLALSFLAASDFCRYGYLYLETVSGDVFICRKGQFLGTQGDHFQVPTKCISLKPEITLIILEKTNTL